MEVAQTSTPVLEPESSKLRSVGEKGEALDLYLENISELNNLSSLYLFGKLEDQSIKSLFPNTDYFCLSDLTLSASGLKEDPMPTLGSLPKLKSLSFHLGSFKGKEMVCLGKGFPELLVLKLGKLESLEEFQVEEGAMQKLRELDIRCCNKLKVPTGLKHLKSLQELKLTNMPENFTTTIEKKKWQIWDDTAHPPRITKDHLSGK
ncbi:putative disease resistance protein [Quercus suber]|uniref:Disease resistance protein n=1 Tax=Quercus suber TaxID=58331 RepID=A0AAW0LQP0_QUESU